LTWSPQDFIVPIVRFNFKQLEKENFMTATSSTAISLHRFALSGHCHRIELLLSMLNLPTKLIDVDLRTGEQRQPAFLALNALGQVPVIQDGDLVLADSNAILVYLATKYGDESWLPRVPEQAAQVQRFLSIAAGEVAKGPATARLIKLFGVPLDLSAAQAIAARVLGMLEQHLSTRAFLVGNTRTIADIANYTYIAHAPEGDISLEAYPNVRAWLARIEALPGFIPMQAAALAAAA
jgi:glutathione S-transferase